MPRTASREFQWPEYWQRLFNGHGYACDDSVRWLIWESREVEPWYRQNVFIAARDPENAGNEPRIRAVVHPEMIPAFLYEQRRKDMEETENQLKLIEAGHRPIKWYLSLPPMAFAAKLRRAAARVLDRNKR